MIMGPKRWGCDRGVCSRVYMMRGYEFCSLGTRFSEDERVYWDGTGMLEALFFIYSMTSGFRRMLVDTELFSHFSTHSHLTNLGIPVSTIYSQKSRWHPILMTKKNSTTLPPHSPTRPTKNPPTPILAANNMI